MPRKPTSFARSAEVELRRLATLAGSGVDEPLPTVRELGRKYDVSYATISRILQRLAQEAIVWQHPNGRFYPMEARQRIAEGFPIVIIGRQIQGWSILYREIIEGISEVCSARGCPLVFLSSPQLVRHENPEYPPTFIPAEVQEREIKRLLATIPRPVGGVVLDHLWSDELAVEVEHSFRSTALLLRPCAGMGSLRGSLDIQAGVEMMLHHLADQGYRRLIVAVPFAGDQAVQTTLEILEAEVQKHSFGSVSQADCSTPEARQKFAQALSRRKERTAVISLEDHVAAMLWREFKQADLSCPDVIGLVSLQGTSAVGSSITRLRYDYRLLGRELVSALLANKIEWRPVRPTLIRGRTAVGVAFSGGK